MTEKELQEQPGSSPLLATQATQPGGEDLRETQLQSAPQGEELRRLRHDARGALNHILGYSQILLEDAEDGGRAGDIKDLKSIEGAARRLLGLVDQLSALAARAALAETTPSTVAAPRLQVSHASFLPMGSEVRGAVLIVDDNELNRDMLARRLKRRKYEVQTAASGLEALEAIRGEAFDLVLLDVMMPEMDGFEVLERLRQAHDPAELPVIMATARDASEDIVRALKAGANDYVTKPLDMPVVLARVAAQLSAKKSRDEVCQLNRRLQEAQERISRMAESSMEALHDVEAWSSEAAREIAQTIGVETISVWISEKDELRDVTGVGVSAPSAADLESLAVTGRLMRRDGGETIVPILGLTGQLYGALVVSTAKAPLGDLDHRLLESFARQLGGALELRRSRRDLAQAAQRRRRHQEELASRGVELLRLCPRCKRCHGPAVERCDGDDTELPPVLDLPLVVNGRYRLARLLGQGGMGMVFAARDERLERDVAVKVVRSEHFSNEMVRLRFEKEARAVARVDHPGVVSIYDCGVLDDGSQFIVMELLAGADLHTLIDRYGRGTPQQVARLLRQAGAALAAAHRAGIVHRDIKPDNILLSAEDPGGFKARILDFGVAKEMGAKTSLTQTGMLVGTPLYMSPEQLMARSVDPRSDIYSLAAVAFLSLVGRRVTLEEELINVVLDVCQNDPPAVSSLLEGTPPEVDKAFFWALAVAPADRPACAETWVASFVDALEAMKATTSGWDEAALSGEADRLRASLAPASVSQPTKLEKSF